MKRYVINYDLAKMNPSFSTSLQSWSRSKLISISCFLIVLHGAAFFIGVLTPNMFHESNVPGAVCTLPSNRSSEAATWYNKAVSEAVPCIPLESSSSKVESLEQTLLAFRFPTDATKVSTYVLKAGGHRPKVTISNSYTSEIIHF